MIRLRILERLKGDCRGSTIVEFAMLAPVFITMLLGVLQVGLALQSYNALRSASADVARHAMVEYSSGNPMNAEELEAYALQHSTGAPYLMREGAVEIDIVTAPTQRVVGARELTLTMTYQIPSLVESWGLKGPELEYSRPIFVTN